VARIITESNLPQGMLVSIRRKIPRQFRPKPPVLGLIERGARRAAIIYINDAVRKNHGDMLEKKLIGKKLASQKSLHQCWKCVLKLKKQQWSLEKKNKKSSVGTKATKSLQKKRLRPIYACDYSGAPTARSQVETIQLAPLGELHSGISQGRWKQRETRKFILKASQFSFLQSNFKFV